MGNRWFPAFFVLSPPRRTVLLLLLEFLHRLGSNTVFEAIESMSRRKFTGAVSHAAYR